MAELREFITKLNVDAVNDLLNSTPELSTKSFEDGLFPIHVATLTGSKAMVERVIRNGADVHAASTQEGNYKGYTALHFAVSKGEKELLDLLKNAGADVNATSDDGWTPLHVAALKFKLESIEWLVLHGADVNKTTHKGQSALFFVCASGRLKEVRFLLEKGADVTITDIYGNSALHYAFQIETAALLGSSYRLPSSQLDIIVLLVLYGAPLKAKNKDGNSAMEFIGTHLPSLPSFLEALEHHRENFKKSTVKWNYLSLLGAKVSVFTGLGLTEEEAKSLKKSVEMVECERLSNASSPTPSSLPPGHPTVADTDVTVDVSGGRCPYLKARAKGVENGPSNDNRPLCPFSIAFVKRHQRTVWLMVGSFAAGMWVQKRLLS